MNNFNIELFIDKEIRDVNLKKKVSKKNKLNLASNELQHDRLLELNKKFLKTLNTNEVNSYTFYPDKTEEFSKLLNLNPEKLSLFAGSDDAIKIIMSSIIRFCKNLIIQTPNYENYYSYSKLNAVKVKDWYINSNYEFILEDGIKILNESEPSVVVVTNPNGFSGKSMTYKDIKILLDVCREKSHMLIIDCAYSSFDIIDYKDLIKEYENLIIINSLSKSYGLSGARFAYVLADEKVTKYLAYFNGINAISSITYQIAEFYLQNKDEFNNIQKDIISSREEFSDFIRENTNWNVIESRSNFVLIKVNSKAEADKLEAFLKESNIIIRNLSNKKFFENCIRITIGNKEIMSRVKRKVIYFKEV